MIPNPAALLALFSIRGTQQQSSLTDPTVGAPVSPAKDLAYGSRTGANAATAVSAGSLFRIERGQPFVRAGRYVFSTPQFKALTIVSPVQQTVQVSKTGQYSNAVAAVQAASNTQQNSQVTGVVNTPISVTYPAKTK